MSDDFDVRMDDDGAEYVPWSKVPNITVLTPDAEICDQVIVPYVYAMDAEAVVITARLAAGISAVSAQRVIEAQKELDELNGEDEEPDE